MNKELLNVGFEPLNENTYHRIHNKEGDMIASLIVKDLGNQKYTLNFNVMSDDIPETLLPILDDKPLTITQVLFFAGMFKGWIQNPIK